MKQYIKKALWIIPFVFSLNLSATTYYFYNSSSSSDGSDKNNWWTVRSSSGAGSGSHPSNFTTAGDIFDINDQPVDVNNMIVGNIKFTDNYGTGNSLLFNSGTMEVTTTSSFSIDITIDPTNELALQDGGIVLYSDMTSGVSQSIYPITYFDLICTGNDKTCSNIKVNNTLENSVKITASSAVFGTGFSFVAPSSGTLEFTGSSGTQITDNRSPASRKYAGTVIYNLPRNTATRALQAKGYINGTEYNNLTIGAPVYFYYSKVTVTGNLQLENSSTSSAAIYLKHCHLTINGNLTGNNIYFYGGTGSGLIFNKSSSTVGTLVVDGTTNNLKRIEINNSSTVNLGSDLTLDSAVVLNSGKLSIGSNTLYLNASPNISNNGCFIGSNTSNINTNSSHTLMMDQSSASSLSLQTLTLTSGPTITMGSNLTLVDGVTLGSGSLIVGSNTLTLSGTNTQPISRVTGTINPSNGTIKYAQTSTGGTNSLITAAFSSSFHNLTIDFTNGGTLTPDGSISIGNTLNLTNGTIIIGSNTLTFSGTSTQPISRTSGTIDPTSGTIKYAQTSTNGNNELLLAAYSSNLNNLTLDFANGGTLTPSNSMTIGGTLNLNTATSYFNLNGTTLTLNGTISGAGFIKGSTTSSLVCGASGTLKFNQSSTDNFLKNFTVNNSKTVSLGNTLNIASGGSGDYGTVIVDTLATCSTGNYLVLKSNSAGTARIGKSPGTIVGQYKVEQYIPAERDFRFLASPVVNGTAYQWRDEGNNNSGIGTHITGTGGSSNGFDASTSNNPSAFVYNENNAGNITTIYTTSSTTSDDPGWASISGGSSSNTLENGKGYRVFVRGDRSISLTANPAPAANTTTLWVKGTYPNYSNTLNVTNSNRKDANNRLYDNNGMNFLGNPFPSAIDWNLITRSNVDDGYVVYQRSSNSFVGWNGSTGSAGRYISASQGFFVYCNSSSGGSITINEWDKYDGVGGSIFQTKLVNHLKINLMYDSSYNSDTYLHFREDAKNVRDNYDIPQIVNNGTNVATLDETNYPYNINSMGSIDSFESVPLSVQGTPAATLKLSFFDIASFYNHKIELVDNYKKTTTPITEGMIYTFDIIADSMSYKNGRFYLNFTQLPSASSKIIQNAQIANIQPNPIENGKLNIQLDRKFEYANYEIINTIGQTLSTGNITSYKSIDVRNLNNGVYYIKLNSKGTSQTLQFIK